MDRRRVKTLAVSILALIALYALSLGPACLLIKKGVIPEKIGAFAYHPLIFVVGHVAFVRGPYLAYLHWWTGGRKYPDSD